MQPTLLLSAPAVLSHKHSHSGAPPHPRPGSAGHHHWHGKGGLGDPDDSNEPRGLGVCTSRARPGHGTRPRQLVCWAGQCRSRYQHGLFSRAGDTEPVYQTCDTVHTSYLPTGRYPIPISPKSHSIPFSSDPPSPPFHCNALPPILFIFLCSRQSRHQCRSSP